MEVQEALIKRRSIRQFKQERLERSDLESIANAGRLAPNASNMQPLHFIMIDKPSVTKGITGNIVWAKYLNDWNPPTDKLPVAYILILVDTRITNTNYGYDVGMAAENIMISAMGFGIGSCCIASINRKEIARILKIPKRYVVTLMIALGYPAEEPLITDAKHSITYYRDEKGTLHVPKRKGTIHSIPHNLEE
ncbi:MAG: nitroreductase family protein [Candidatus Micrarchaeota archaeon]|nr:nitroreductase family protein [Candidatus Micrarchaeota archaeon]